MFSSDDSDDVEESQPLESTRAASKKQKLQKEVDTSMDVKEEQIPPFIVNGNIRNEIYENNCSSAGNTTPNRSRYFTSSDKSTPSVCSSPIKETPSCEKVSAIPAISVKSETVENEEQVLPTAVQKRRGRKVAVKKEPARKPARKSRKVKEEELDDDNFIVDDDDDNEMDYDDAICQIDDDDDDDDDNMMEEEEEEVKKPTGRKRGGVSKKSSTTSKSKTTTKGRGRSKAKPVMKKEEDEDDDEISTPKQKKTKASKSTTNSSPFEPTKVTSRKVTGGYRPKWLGPERDPPKHGSKPIPIGKPNCLEGIIFVLTGLNESLTREETSELIKQYGG